MILKNVYIENSKDKVDIRIAKGCIETIAETIIASPNEEILDGGNKMVLPPFIDSHVHLDTCLSLPEAGENLSGTLFEGIQLWSNYRDKVDTQELKERAMKTIALYVKKGVQFIRTHVDITSGSLSSLEALLELKEEIKNLATLQIVAFPQDGVFSTKGTKELLEESMKMGADVIGAIPHFELTREYGVESINYIMTIAEKYGKQVDVHCDEIDDEQSRFVEVLAARAYESGLAEKVTASHTTAMHSYNSAYCSKLFRLLKMSKINIVANPLVNVNLQGRFDTFPKRRGITRVKELLENGINVSFGHDDICDPFYPLGNGDMCEVLSTGLHLCQMMGYDTLMNSYQIITYNGAKTLLIKDYGIKEGNPANLILLDAPDFLTALRNKSSIVASIRHGQLIHNTL